MPEEPQPLRLRRDPHGLLRPPVVGDDGVNPFSDGPNAAEAKQDRTDDVFAPPADQTPSYRPQYVASLPHRGGMLLGLGITAAVFACVCAVGYTYLGPAAAFSLLLGAVIAALARADLRAIASGAMDKAGRAKSRAGLMLGLAATVLSLLTVGVYVHYLLTLPTLF